MEEAAVLAPALATAAGIGLVRLGWGGPRAAVIGGWAIVAGACLMLALLAGAWGLAVGGSAAMACALAILMWEAWRTPRGRAAPVRAASFVALPRPSWRAIGRRVAIFLLVVPVGGLAATLLAFGAQALARRHGWGAADAVALALALQPVAWTVVTCIQMTRPRMAAMIPPTLVCAVAGLILWWPL